MSVTVTKTIEAFKYGELSKQAKERVQAWVTPDHGWWEYVYDMAKERGLEKGFIIGDKGINFCGFYSQGDGACWRGVVHVPTWLEAHRPDDPKAHIALALCQDGWVTENAEIQTRGNNEHHSNMCMPTRVCVQYEPQEENVFVVAKESVFNGARVQPLIDVMEENAGAYLDELSSDILESAQLFAIDIYGWLRDEYEMLCSEEYIAELCDVNEYLFDENGHVV